MVPQELSQILNWFESRAGERQDFLSRCGVDHADIEPVGEDCAFRRYLRVRQDGRSLILMEAMPDDSPYATPGHKIGDFIRIGRFLFEKGVHTPEIYEADETSGYVLLEDFGDTSFKQQISASRDPLIFYELAVDILIHLRESVSPSEIDLPDYYDSHIHEARRLIIDWYFPRQGVESNEKLVQEYLSVWDEIEARLPPCPQGFLHIDYHAENLMWLPQYEGLQRAGVLDFQGAMWGPLPYDLANILEDVRTDVPEDIRMAMLDRYCAGMKREESEAFRAWYRILATQFHCRIAGQFIRLAARDGKTKYLEHLPRVERYLQEDVKDPLLEPLKKWFKGKGVLCCSEC